MAVDESPLDTSLKNTKERPLPPGRGLGGRERQQNTRDLGKVKEVGKEFVPQPMRKTNAKKGSSAKIYFFMSKRRGGDPAKQELGADPCGTRRKKG